MSVYDWEVDFIEWMYYRYGSFHEPLVYVDQAVATAQDNIFEERNLYDEEIFRQKFITASQNPPNNLNLDNINVNEFFVEKDKSEITNNNEKTDITNTNDIDLKVDDILFDQYLINLEEDQPMYWIFSSVIQNKVQSFILKQVGIDTYPSIPQLIYKGYGYLQNVVIIKDSVGDLVDVSIKAKDAFKINLSDINMKYITQIPQKIKAAREAIQNVGDNFKNLTTNIKNIANGISEDVDYIKGLTKEYQTIFTEEEFENNRWRFDEDEDEIKPSDDEIIIEEEYYEPPPVEDFGEWDIIQNDSGISLLDRGEFGYSGRLLSEDDLIPEARTFYDKYVPDGVYLSSGEIRALNNVYLNSSVAPVDEEELLRRLESHTLIPKELPEPVENINPPTNFDVADITEEEDLLALVEKPNSLTNEQWQTVLKRLNEFRLKAEQITINNTDPSASETEITELVENTLTDIINDGVPAVELYSTLLASESAELVASVLNPALFIINIIFFVYLIYALYKRLVFTWKVGGVLLPLLPPFWLFDWSKLQSKSIETPQDVILCFDKVKLKNNPSAYFRETFINYITSKNGSNPLKEGIEWKYLTTTNYFAYKRDPRQDDGFSFSALNPATWLVNKFEGWIEWVQDFNPPITDLQANQAQYNIIMAMDVIYDLKLPLDLRAGPALPTVPSHSQLYYDSHGKVYDQAKMWKNTTVANWDISTVKAKWYSRPHITQIRWNSGINITLVSPAVAQFRRLLSLPLRSVDYWYLIPNLDTSEINKPWRFDNNNNEWVLKNEFHSIANGYHSVKLTRVNGIDVPISTGENPERYWQLGPHDSQFSDYPVIDINKKNTSVQSDDIGIINSDSDSDSDLVIL